VKDFPSVTILPVEPVCPGCQLGKQPNHPFAVKETCATKSFELVHSDLKSFETESYHRSRYIIIFYNDYMSMGWIKPLRTKDQALQATKEFIKYVQNQHSTSIKGWMSDAGGEYKLKAFGQLMCDQGIHVYESAPHTPQQNGHAEQFIRTLMDKAQAMCLHACLPDSYWEFAVQHAVHVYNRTPKQGLNWRTPHELIHKAPPTVSYLHVFGCTAYVHLPADTHGGKLQPKSQLMIYLGTTSGNEHNYLFMRPNNALHTYAHAVFDENLFPRCPGARPHKPVSGPVQPHQHQHRKEPSHPPSEAPSKEFFEDLPGPLRCCDPSLPRDLLPPVRTPLPEIRERTPSPPRTPPRRAPHLDAPPALPRRSE